jgi:outer membrane protein TolC
MKKYGFFFVLLNIVIRLDAQPVLTLQECRDLALENNKQLKIGNENIKKASEEKKAAFTQYLPNISVTGTYLYNQKNLSLLEKDQYLPVGTVMPDGSFGFTQEQVNNQWTLINGSPVPLDATGAPFDPAANPDKILWKEHTIIPKSAFELDIHHVFAGSVSLLQPVYMGGKIAAYNAITGYAEELARIMQNKEVQEVILHIDQVYWQTVSLAGKHRVSQKYLELLTQMDSDIQAMIREGVATRADGLSIKVKLNEAEMTLLQVEDGLQLSRMLLCQLCGLPLNEPVVLADEQAGTVPEEKYPLTHDMEEVYANRPEIQSLDLATKIYEKKEDVVRADGLPTVALIGNYLLSNPNAFNGFRNKFAGSWNVGVMVNIPLFHWGENQHKVRAARAETRIKQMEKDEAKEKIELQVNQSVFKLKEAQKKLVAAGKNKDSAEENLRYANVGFKEGVIPSLNVMEAQTAWYQAQSAFIDAQIAVRLGQVELNKALGILQ